MFVWHKCEYFTQLLTAESRQDSDHNIRGKTPERPPSVICVSYQGRSLVFLDSFCHLRNIYRLFLPQVDEQSKATKSSTFIQWVHVRCETKYPRTFPKTYHIVFVSKLFHVKRYKGSVAGRLAHCTQTIKGILCVWMKHWMDVPKRRYENVLGWHRKTILFCSWLGAYNLFQTNRSQQQILLQL